MQIKGNSISIKNAYVIYNYKKNSQYIGLKDFSYDFKKKKIYCIIGESGSGKSTLISLFNGLIRLTYGDVLINNIEMKGKRYLINSVFCMYKLNNNEASTILNKQVIANDCYVVQCAKNITYNDIKCWIDSINDNNESKIIRLKSTQLKKIGIDNKTINKYYLIQIYNLDRVNKIKMIDNVFDFKNNNDFIKFNHSLFKNKIKNYKELRKEIGLVAQFPEFQLFRSTVLDDVMFSPWILGYSKKEAIDMAKIELNKLGIKETHFNNSPFALSGGQKRRVAIAGVLATNGNTLIFDEPTAGLDPAGEMEMINIIKRLKDEGKTVFVVTHSMEQVLEIADEIVVLHNGRLIADGDAYKIFNNKEILEKTNIEVPYVIDMVNKLSSQNRKYKKLLEWKPRTIEDLAKYIIKLNNKGAKND